EHLRRRLERRLDLAPRLTEVERELLRTRLQPVEQLVGVVAVALLRRHAAGRGVRMRQQTARLELRQLVPDRGRGRAKPEALDEPFRADRLPRRDMLLDDTAQDLLLTERECHLD